ncbi:MAG: glutamine-hydrolyzing GMP synthase [Eubacteriaceae bacterium]|nr:glutamine-hydrolyzing GMP synthase [Eubacteriaceae bacterium]
MERSTAVVLDFGGQYNQLIARRVREEGVYCEVLAYDTPLEEIMAMRPGAIIFSGGPASVYENGAPRCDRAIYELGIPILGICYGMQLMALELGGDVGRAPLKEYGNVPLKAFGGQLFRGAEGEWGSWMSHGVMVRKPPSGFSSTASTQNCPIAAMEDAERKLFSVQFHPEVTHTERGKKVLSNFLHDIAGLEGNWAMESFIEEKVREVSESVGDSKVVCALSGGIDSSVAAALVSKAIGDRLTCIFVDHGLLRKGEAKEVENAFRGHFDLDFRKVDASDRFLGKLAGVSEPEKKRKIIGEEFIRVFEGEADCIEGAKYLLQGTIYPDVIESGTKNAATIKSHHNVGGLPDNIGLKLIEPLRSLFKDEVREVGRLLGLPEEIVRRQPFPGPGLAIRVIGEITQEKLSILREADYIFCKELENANCNQWIWQYFAVLPEIRTVGVMGDERTYDYTIALRAVTSTDAMTADWARIDHRLLAKVSNRIVNEVSGVNRVV